MKKQRANEIAASPVMANVTYNGQSVYIENVDNNKGTANIHPLNRPENNEEVPLDNLEEH
ncbi:small acid-soluble spore protein H [Alkalibaculum sp. M08DMB]|uniref:Small acid-soluble spore protein H n=1 Tax=Alkalibaculum sporogenes TaxID=2655001 RepID=A0A6A7K4X8_9FIRM|nr:small acid-soluble spore protein H [Alkalibaculum sporogenes]